MKERREKTYFNSIDFRPKAIEQKMIAMMKRMMMLTISVSDRNEERGGDIVVVGMMRGEKHETGLFPTKQGTGISSGNGRKGKRVKPNRRKGTLRLGSSHTRYLISWFEIISNSRKVSM